MTVIRSLTYKDAGVDIDAGDELVERIRPAVARTLRPEVLGGLGGFGGLFQLATSRYANPVLVAGTDGVGTKIKLAIQFDAHDDIGIDLVAMCVNDVIVQGAEPLFFLDYYATPRLNVDIAARVIAGIARGCEQAGAALLGGETAEHPGSDGADEYDLAGFCVGVVDREQLIDGRRIQAGDSVIGIGSSGPHSNGYSLIRKVLERHTDPARLEAAGTPLIPALLAPTRIYAKPLLELIASVEIRGLCHITGGGLLENIPRVLPAGLGVRLERAAWPRAPVFEWLASNGISEREMLRTFNCGLGMIAIVTPALAETAAAKLRASGEQVWIVGEVVADHEQAVRVD
ncbi:MAG TPA: phosphoribosylformylglycinamidine cyclo-ligase [Gammaproteobacteria bacterium]|nr:phosphoribosylformylglycinamidine cyclo-ligase [Gammaproteobacteria bacterium]